jgi:peptidoglycan-associated lipoprotein
MGNSQPQESRTGSGKEIALLVGVLLLVAAGTVVTYWIRSQSAEASNQAATPAPAQTPAPRPRTVAPTPTETEVIHADVYFDFKSTRLRADAAKMLQDKAASMSHTDTWVVLVTGYADRQGPAVYNKVLAQRRADTVKQFLVELGVPESSIKVVALGPEATLCDDPAKECQQLNRRVHLEIRRLGPVAAAAVAPANADVQVP